jgi:hypothetical protein
MRTELLAHASKVRHCDKLWRLYMRFNYHLESGPRDWNPDPENDRRFGKDILLIVIPYFVRKSCLHCHSKKEYLSYFQLQQIGSLVTRLTMTYIVELMMSALGDDRL